MKQYKLKKDFLHLKAGEAVDILNKKDENNVTRYIISIDDWIISEIVDSTHFVFEEYFEEISKNIFDLQKWDGYYYLFSDWDIGLRYYYWDEVYKDIVENWNAFLIKEEAEKEVERRKAIQKIKKYCWENKIKYKENVSDETFYIGIIYDSEDEEFYPSTCTDHIDYWFLFFNSYEDVDKVINNCESELKILFDI